MNDQNQNVLTQPTAGAGPQSQAAALPQAGISAQGQAGPQSLLLGSASGYDTASLLNQTRIVGTSSTQEKTVPVAKSENRGHVPILVIIVALIVMAIIALLFRMIDSNKKEG